MEEQLSMVFDPKDTPVLKLLLSRYKASNRRALKSELLP